MLASSGGKWVIPTEAPSLADISLYYQLKWGLDMAAGKGIHNLSGGGTRDTEEVEVVKGIFNEERFPGTWKWFHAFEKYLEKIGRAHV